MGIRVLAIQQTVSDDPNGHFAEGMFELIDQLESETNGVRTRAGMAENARQDYFNGSRPPFGFRVEKIATSAGPRTSSSSSRPKQSSCAKSSVST